MPKNKKGGSRFKKGVNNSGVSQIEEKVVMRNADENEHYAKINKALGSGRFSLNIIVKKTADDIPKLNPTIYMGILPGKMKRQKWKHFVTENDFVLVSKRDFQADDNLKVDIIMKYTPEATRKLGKLNEIPLADEDTEISSVFIEDVIEEEQQQQQQQQTESEEWNVNFNDI